MATAMQTGRIGLVLAAFGSAAPQAHTAVEAFATHVAHSLPHCEVLVAYSAERALAAMRARGEKACSVDSAMQSLAARGLTRCVVQSLHVVPGQEFHAMCGSVRAHSGLFTDCRTGTPLFGGLEELLPLADVLAGMAAAHGPKTGLVFVGHAGRHPGCMAYAALQAVFSARHPHCFVQLFGTEEPHMPQVPARLDAASLHRQGIEALCVLPLLVSAGRHLHGDIHDFAEALRAEQGYAPDFSVSVQAQSLFEHTALRDLLTQRILQILR